MQPRFVAFALVGAVSLLASSAERARGETVDAGAEAGVPATTTAVVPDGAYRIGDADAADRALRAAIDAVLAGLHPAMREPFRAQLGATLRAPRRLQLSHRGDDVVVTVDGHELVAPLGGSERRQTGAEGRPVRVAHRLDGAVFVEEVRTGQFTLVRRFVVDAGGFRLDSELRTGMLPRPVDNVSHYARVVAPSADGGAPADAALPHASTP